MHRTVPALAAVGLLALAAGCAPGMSGSQAQAQQSRAVTTQVVSAVRNLAMQTEAFYADHNRLPGPADFEALGTASLTEGAVIELWVNPAGGDGQGSIVVRGSHPGTSDLSELRTTISGTFSPVTVDEFAPLPDYTHIGTQTGAAQ